MFVGEDEIFERKRKDISVTVMGDVLESEREMVLHMMGTQTRVEGCTSPRAHSEHRGYKAQRKGGSVS